MTAWSPELQWLLGLCRHDLGGEGIPAFDERLDAETVVGLAMAHRLAPVAERSWRALAERSLAPQPPEALQVRAAAARRRSLLATAHLLRLAREFEADGVVWTSLKGPVLSSQIHGDPSVRTVRDLDVIVPAAQIRAAVESASRAGWKAPASWQDVMRVTQRYDMAMQATAAGQPLLEVHAALGPRFVQFTLDALAEPARGTVRIGGADIPTLVGPAQALYVAWHGARGLWYRLCWLSDYAALRLGAPDQSDQILADAAACGAEVAVRAGAALAEDVFSIGMPPLPPAAPAIARRVETVRRWGRERLAVGVDAPSAWLPPGSYRWLWREVRQQNAPWRAAAGALNQLILPTEDDARALGLRLPRLVHRIARPYFASKRLLSHAGSRCMRSQTR